jgi:hypothetical protein
MNTLAYALMISLFTTPISVTRNATAQFDFGEDVPIFQDTISGYYEDNDSGYSITFPEGWSGVSFFGTFPMVAPGGFLSGSGNATIMVLAVNRSAFADLSIDQTAFMELGATEDIQTEECPVIESSITTVNGMSAFRAREECNDESGYSKSDIIGVVTSTKFIMLGYSSQSPEADQQYYDDFTDALATFRVSNTQDFRSAIIEIGGMSVENHSVQVQGSTLDVTVSSSSEVSNFQVNEEERNISFTVDGEDGTSGVTTIAVQDILEGPYSVTIDGETTPFSIMEDENTNETLLQLSYSHSEHQVVITGTQVIPEFPLPLLMVIPTIAAIIAISRLRRLI